MNKKELIKISAMGFIDEIYDQMRKQGYPDDMQMAILNQIKQQIK